MCMHTQFYNQQCSYIEKETGHWPHFPSAWQQPQLLFNGICLGPKYLGLFWNLLQCFSASFTIKSKLSYIFDYSPYCYYLDYRIPLSKGLTPTFPASNHSQGLRLVCTCEKDEGRSARYMFLDSESNNMPPAVVRTVHRPRTKDFELGPGWVPLWVVTFQAGTRWDQENDEWTSIVQG
jgi:hypothetical protein